MNIAIAHHDNFSLGAIKNYIVSTTFGVVNCQTVLNTANLINACRNEKFDVVIVSYMLDNDKGLKALEKVSKFTKDAKRILLVEDAMSVNITKILKLKCSVLDTRRENIDKLHKLIDISNKVVYISTSIYLDNNYGTPKFAANDVRFNRSDLMVLHYICSDYTSEQIAAIMNRSKRTIEGHRLKIKKVAGAKGVAGVVIFAVENSYYDVNIKK